MHLIYTIQFPSGALYVGATSRFNARQAMHRRAARGKDRTSHVLAKQLRTEPGWEMQPIACGFDRETLHLLEAQVIATLRPTLNCLSEPTPLAPLNPKRRPRGDATLAKRFGPYDSMRVASKALGTSRSQLRRMGSYEAYMASKSKPEPKRQRKAPAKIGPTDPRNLPQLVNQNGWYWPYQLRQKKPSNPPKPFGPYPSINAACRALGVTPPTLTKHASYEAYIKYQEIKHMRTRHITAAGRTKSITDWSKETGVSANTIYQRLFRGVPPEQAVGLEPLPRQVKSKKAQEKRQAQQAAKKPPAQYTVRGVTGTLKTLAEHYGVTLETVKARMKAGRDVETALTVAAGQMFTPPKRRATEHP